jgi:hypothetical protein
MYYTTKTKATLYKTCGKKKRPGHPGRYLLSARDFFRACTFSYPDAHRLDGAYPAPPKARAVSFVFQLYGCFLFSFHTSVL